MLQRKFQRQIKPAIAWALMAALIVACSTGLPLPFPTDVPVTATINLTGHFSGAFDAASQYVDAINQQKYTDAFALLDDESRSELQNAAALASAYTNVRTTATAITVTYAVQDNVTQQESWAVVTLISLWQTTLLGAFTATSTLSMTTSGNTWTIAWSRDLILPGLANGVLTLQRDAPLRGVIYAADGSAMAVQNESMTLGVRRDEIKDSTEEKAMLIALSKVTGLGADTIFARYKDQPPEWFVPVAEVDEATLSEKSTLIEPFAAVSARRNYTRAYPQSTIAPHVVGYVGPIPPDEVSAYQSRGYAGDERIGLSGVEGYMDATLAGQEGGSLQLIGADGTVTTIASKPFVPGSDITLSISPTVQLSVQNILGSRRGAAIVLNAQDQNVIAMASFPTYDNAVLAQLGNSNARQQLIRDPAKPLLNRATQGVYPAGSTFKIVTMSAGMAEGLTSPTDVFYDPGYWDGLGSGYRKTCWLRSGHGRITLQDGLTASCDVVFYTVGKRLDDKGSDLLGQYGRQFGFGVPTGIETAGEAGGIMPDSKWKKTTLGEVWTPGDTVNLAIGQGYMLATPLQVAEMTSAIAAGGTLYRPHIVASIASRANSDQKTIKAEVIRQLPVSAAQVQAIQKGMVGVTTNARIGTTTFRFTNFDYYIVDGRVVAGKTLAAKDRASATKFVVAGKSGTAQAPGPQDKPFAWFTAYAPADDPQIVVTVMLENAGEGSVLAAPLVRQMIESYFGLPQSPLPHDVQVTD